MFKNRNLKFILPVLFAILAFGIKVARAEDDDDDNIIGEIVTDLLVGALVGTCQSNEACNNVLGIFCMFFLFIALICGAPPDANPVSHPGEIFGE